MTLIGNARTFLFKESASGSQVALWRGGPKPKWHRPLATQLCLIKIAKKSDKADKADKPEPPSLFRMAQA